MTDGGLTSAFDIENLDLYYAECVIGGPGSFTIPVDGWDQFPEAVRRKLVLELVDARPRPGAEAPPAIPVAVAGEPIDCEIGENMWGSGRWLSP